MKTSEKHQTRPFKVLLIDDDESIVKTIEKILVNKNYIIYSSLSGQDALTHISNIIPDIILLDILMPKMDGYEVCKAIKQDSRFENVPVIFITESNDPDNIIKAFESGGVDYILKPFNHKALLARLDTHLQLKVSQETLKELNKVKLKFFSIMTRDIKDHLIGVKGIADFLVQDLEQDCESNTEGIKMAKILQDDSKRLYELLENLIEWASIEIGQMTFNPKEISIKEFIAEKIQLLQFYATDKKLIVNLDCEDDIILKTDPEALKTIFLKILSNAIKYNNPKGTIDIKIIRKKNKCVFSIIDTGIGMDADVINNIFRLDTPHPKTIGTAEEKGAGLGLIICKSIIDKLNGKILIESKKFRGANVTFEIPDFVK